MRANRRNATSLKFYGTRDKLTKVGTYVSCVEELKIAILSYYQEYKLTGKVAYKGNLTEIDKYSHREMARQFAGVLDSISKS
jgi:hypothetical protein